MVSILAAANALADTLITPSSAGVSKLTRSGLEYELTCDHVKFTAFDRKSGKSITLFGKTIHAVGADRVTPSHFLGYEFRHGRTKYFVDESGELQITRGSKVLVQETGEWKY